MSARIAFALLGMFLVLVAGCGDSAAEIEVVADSEADRAIAADVEDELALYSEPFDISALPTDQQDQLGPVYDAFPRAAGSVEELTVSDGLVEARTDLPVEEDSEITARLICAAVIRGAGEGNADGHRVLGEGDAVLQDCRAADANYP